METAREKMARHFGLGAYGLELADQILETYRAELAEKFRKAMTPKSPWSIVTTPDAVDLLESHKEGK